MSLAMQLADLAAEVAELRALVTRPGAVPGDVTPFHGWEIDDSVRHIVTIDRLAVLALSDPAAFAREVQAFVDGTAADDRFAGIRHYERLRLGLLGWDQLLAAWDTGFAALERAASAHAPDDKVPWFGGTMRAVSLLSARHMEVWAYGQDVFDGYRIVRHEGARIRTVAEFGLKTFGFSFANRGEAVPPRKPHVVLTAPSGAIWAWNEASDEERVEGNAADFCLVVTQRRHVDDTGLSVQGEVASRWMRIAQCIAGPPMDGPKPKTGAAISADF